MFLLPDAFSNLRVCIFCCVQAPRVHRPMVGFETLCDPRGLHRIEKRN